MSDVKIVRIKDDDPARYAESVPADDLKEAKKISAVKMAIPPDKECGSMDDLKKLMGVM